MSSSVGSSLFSSVRKGVAQGLAVLGAGALLSTAVLGTARYRALKADAQLPSEFVLELPLDRLRLVETVNPSPLALLMGDTNQVELRQVVSALRSAAKDERCRGLVAYLGARENLGGLASVQELRDAVLDFRRTAAAAAAGGGSGGGGSGDGGGGGGGRPLTTAAFAGSFGEAGSNGMVPYMLATACERVFMQPSGMLGLTGLESRGFFARGLLERLRAEPLVLAREEYKSAANFLRERGFTEAQRDNLGSLLGDMAEQMVAAMGAGRGVAAEAVRRAVDEAPLLPAAATDLGLLDGTKYKDEVQALFPLSDAALQQEKKRLGSKHRRRKEDTRMARVSVDRYIRLMDLQKAAAVSGGGPAGWLGGTAFEGLTTLLRGISSSISSSIGGGQQQKDAAAPSPKKRKVAVVTAAGPIVQGPVPPGPSQGQVIDAAKLSRQLAALLEDPDVGAVVVRVNSPGGSALASDTLHHEMMRLRAAGKKVVVSMGDVAASGGYYLAAAADRIVAQPGTLTGSIGVLYGKVNVAGTLEEAGVRSEAVKVGANADALSPFTGFSPRQEAQMETLIDHVYLDFLDKVSRSRGRPVEEIRQLAKGRVYTGAQAHAAGLVDELGGLEAAVAAAKRLAALPEDAEVVPYPPRRVPLLLQLLRSSGAMSRPGEGEGEGEGGAGGGGGLGRGFAAALLPLPLPQQQLAEGWGPLVAALGALLGVGHSGAAAAVAVAGGAGLGGGAAGAAEAEAAGQVGGTLALLLGTGPQLYCVEAARLAKI